MPDPAQVAARVARWDTDGPQGPMTLELYPTLACNLDCAFCDTTDRHRPPVNELPTERLLEIVDEAAALGVKRLFLLGGGEPLVRRRATPAIMARAKSHGMEGILTTNGTLMNDALIGDIVEMAWDEIHFSIDGPNAEIHDKLRGQDGAFKRTVRNACKLSVAKRRLGITLPRVAIHFVLTRENHHTLMEMVELGQAIGATRIDFDALIAYTPEQKALEATETQRARGAGRPTRSRSGASTRHGHDAGELPAPGPDRARLECAGDPGRGGLQGRPLPQGLALPRRPGGWSHQPLLRTRGPRRLGRRAVHQPRLAPRPLPRSGPRGHARG